MASCLRYQVLNNGARMPIIGLGTWQSTANDVQAAVEEALKIGYRHIDTAYAYQNEESIGKALKKVLNEGKIKRDDLFIVTKLPSNGHQRNKVKYFLQKSLNALQLDYVDLYLIHSPMRGKGKDDDDIFPIVNDRFVVDTEADMVQTWKGMEDAMDAGMTKAIGLSNFNSEQISRICNAARIQPANLQVECHAYFPQTKLFEFCKKRNITFTAYAPLGSASMTAIQKVRGGTKQFPSLLDEPAVQEVAKDLGKTPAQVLLRWLVDRGIIVIPKSANPGRLAENFQIFDFEISKDQNKSISQLERKDRFFAFSSPMPGHVEEHPDYPFNIEF